jgi:hypothetical protein
LKKFADDTKMGQRARSLEDKWKLQQAINNLME